MRAHLILMLALLFHPLGLDEQLPTLGTGRGGGASGAVPITIGVHCFHDNGASTSTTVACGPMTPTAGSVIYCEIKYTNAAGFTSVADNVNSGVYESAFVRLRESNHNFVVGSYYIENVAASATTITLTYDTTGTNGQIACKEIKGTPATYALDSSVLQSQAVNGTNPANPNSYTPFANNEIVLSGGFISGGSVTAGSNFTLLDNTSTLYPEYWIQTTKTATTGPFTDGSAADSGIGMAAFGQNSGGTCGGTMLMDWTGGSNGATPTMTTLQNSTKGGQAQPNADKLNNLPGWTVSGTGNLTYSTTAYAPGATTLTCPFYTGSGAGTLGLSHDTAAIGAHVNYLFETTRNKVTLGACVSTNTPVTNGGTNDILGIFGGNNSVGNPDFIALQWNSNGVSGTWALEPKTGGTITSSTNWTQNTWYWFRLEYNKAGAHKLYIYTFSGSQCSGTPTLQETITAAGSTTGGGTADSFVIFGSSMSYAAGTNWYIGFTKADILYGAAVMP